MLYIIAGNLSMVLQFYTAELDAKKVALESEESLEKNKATLLEAQVYIEGGKS